MALNPTFASASVNPSQSIGSDASAPAQGALPMGQSNLAQTQDAGTAGFSGLGGLDINYTAPKEPVVPMIPNFNQSYYQSPQYQNYKNSLETTASTDDMRMMPFGGFGSSNIANLQNQSYEDFLKNPSMGQPATQEVPYYKYVDPNPRINYFNDKNNFGGDLNTQIKAIDDAGQADPQYTAYLKKFYADADSYRNAPFTGEFRDMMPSPPQDYVSYLGQQDLINKQNSMPYQSQDNLFGQPSQNSGQGAMFQRDIFMQPYENNFGFDATGYQNDLENYIANKATGATFDKEMSSYFPSQQAYQNYVDYAKTAGPKYTAQDLQTAMKNPEFDSGYFRNANVVDDQGNPLSMDAKQQLIQPFYNQQQAKPRESFFSGPTAGQMPVGMKMVDGEFVPDPNYQAPQQFGPQVPYQDPRATIGPTFTQRNPLTPTATPTGTTPMATNPLSTYTTTPTANAIPAPNLNVTPGSASSGSFGQGAVLPNVTTTQQQITAAPSFYTDYLNQLATQGGQAAQNAQYVGAQPLQEQAFNLASQNVGNYQPTLQNAINLASSVGNSNLAQAIGDVGQANIARNLAPQATAGIVGSGQFGSKRGAQALGDVIANAELGLTAQQQQAMQQDMANRIAAAQQLGTLANSTQQLGLGDINALSTLGQQQQTIGQNQQLFPMQQLANQSALLRGYNIPTSVSASQTGPGQQGQFQASPLQQIMSVGTLLGALAKPDASGNSAGGNLVGGLGNIINKISGKFAGSTGSSGSSSSVSPVTGLPIGIPGGSTYNKTDNTYVDTGGTKYIVNDDGTVTSYGGTEIPNPITYDEIFDTDPWLNNNYYNFDPDA